MENLNDTRCQIFEKKMSIIFFSLTAPIVLEKIQWQFWEQMWRTSNLFCVTPAMKHIRNDPVSHPSVVVA